MSLNASYEMSKSNFTMLNNNVLTSLSSKALKIYVLIANEITKPNQTFYKTTIMNKFEGCKATFDKFWKELKDKGFLVQTKKKDCNNLWCYEYTLTSNPCNSHNLNMKNLETTAYSKTISSKTKYCSSSCNSAPTENKVIKSIKDFGIALSTSAIYEINKLLKDYGDDYVTAVVEYCFNHNAKYFSYFQKVFNELKSKNLITVQSFEESLKAHQEQLQKNMELKAKRIEQSNKLMEQKLKDNSAPTSAPTAPKGANAPSVPTATFKKTKFNCISNHEWDFDELECLEELITALDLQRISKETYNDCLDRVSNLKQLLHEDEIEIDEYKSELNKIIKICY